jgi:hypothetical protein
MAQQSVRRGRENQGFPQCFEHALGDLDPARELPYRPAAVHRCNKARTDGSIRLRATATPKFSLAKRGAFSNRASLVNSLLLFSAARIGVTVLSAVGKGPPQHLVRSTGAAMSTTGSRCCCGPRPSVAAACTLAPSGNHYIRSVLRMISMRNRSGSCYWRLGPAIWLS